MRELSRRRFFRLFASVGATSAAILPVLSAPSALAIPAPVKSAAPKGPVPVESPFESYLVIGIVKWYDSSKGYGFVAPDDGSKDILLHVTGLRASGYQTAREGAHICCEAIRGKYGAQVLRILSLDNGTGIDTPERSHVPIKAESSWERVCVKWFNHVRGFGFLTGGDGTPDIFVHRETLQSAGLVDLRPGQMISVRWGFGTMGIMAAELRI